MRSFFFLFICLFLIPKIHAKEKIIVSILPQKYLVEQIAGEQFIVDVLVPPGASPHSYEPSARQMMAAMEGKIWFRIGEGFEIRALPVFEAHMKVVDMREGIDLLPIGCACAHHMDAHDSHIWLSPRLLQIQANKIAETLQIAFPQEAALFFERLSILNKKLEYLDHEIQEKVQASSVKAVLVSHAAFGYFCRDYGLKQFSIEFEGKEPSPKQITTLIEEVRAAKIKYVFTQPQYSKKGSERIAHALDLSVISLDPYQENVLENLRTIADAFTRS